MEGFGLGVLCGFEVTYSQGFWIAGFFVLIRRKICDRDGLLPGPLHPADPSECERPNGDGSECSVKVRTRAIGPSSVTLDSMGV